MNNDYCIKIFYAYCVIYEIWSNNWINTFNIQTMFMHKKQYIKIYLNTAWFNFLKYVYYYDVMNCKTIAYYIHD